MSDSEPPLLDRRRIEELFAKLGDRLRRRGLIGDVYIFGGAAIALAHDDRRATRDIDAVVRGAAVVLDEARALAVVEGLPPWWLNEQASAYVSPVDDPHAPLVFDHPGLRVTAASPEHLLAMKAMAARRRDLGDLRLLLGSLRMTTLDDVVTLCARVFPDEQLPARALLLLEDLLTEPNGLSRC